MDFSDRHDHPGRSPVPRWLDAAAAVAWRALVVGAAVLVVGVVLSRLLVVVMPLVVALFLSTVLVPPARWLGRHGWPPLLATWAVFLTGLAIVAGVLAWMIPTVSHQISQVSDAASHGTDRVKDWLVRGPFHLSQADVRRDFDNVGAQLRRNAGGLALRGGAIVGEIVTGLLLSLVLTFFFVKDGPRIAEACLRVGGPHRSEELRDVGQRAWATVSGYVRGTTINGFVNGVLMGVGLFIVGVPLAVPLGVLTFFGAYFPIVGAVVTGLLAALVALVSNGPVAAIVVVALTILIHNVEGYLVGPLVLGRAVHLHPIAILLALAVGGTLAGIVGAFVAVPTTAIITTTINYYRQRAATPSTSAKTEPPNTSAA